MNSFPVGKQVSVSVQLVDLNGSPITPTAMTATVVDENGTVILPAFSVPISGTTAVINVSGPANILSDASATSGMRIVDLDVTTAGGTYQFTESYVIKRTTSDVLQLLVNSFQTFNQGILTATEIPNLTGWNSDATSDDDRVAAMIEAFRRLTQIGYAVRWPQDVDSQTYLDTTDWIGYETRLVTPEYWQFLKPDHFLTFYPENFRASLRRAQVVEADDLLAGSPVDEKRRSGILSETIKDSSMMFRSGKPLDLGVSKRAMAYLRGYVQYRATLGRS